MNWDEVQGNWKQFAGKVREKWGAVTDDELEQVKGRRDQLEGLLQKKLGLKKEEVSQQIDELQSKCGTCS